MEPCFGLNRDYLSIRFQQFIDNILFKNNEDRKDARCFSDFIFSVNKKKQRKRMVLFVTYEQIYILKKSLKIVNTIKIDEI